MNVTIIGLNHRVQWEDPTGDLQNLIDRVVEDRRVELIAEEAYKLPTTVGFRVACRANKPWIEIDMSDSERLQVGLCDELESRSSPDWKDDGSMVTVVNYLPHADGVREAHWLKTILNHHVNSELVICGLLHMTPFAEKLRQKGCTVNESINVCDLDWCKRRFGPCEVMEVNGRRWCEIPAK